jgi:Methyltransferase domain
MAQYDNWQEYWDKFLLNRYGKEEVQSEDDLYFQVARTVNRKPVAKVVFDAIIAGITEDLDLTQNDILVDFCCGNGLFTYELKDKVKQIIGIDFSQNIIDTANKFRPAGNITYCLGGVVEYMKSFAAKWPGIEPNKYLMNDSLAYFPATGLEEMLKAIVAVSRSFRFLIRGVPNDELKWNYYNTPERKEFYANLLAKGDLTNDGLGTWWQQADIKSVCGKLNLQCVVRNQQLPVSDYRMDVMISK